MAAFASSNGAPNRCLALTARGRRHVLLRLPSDTLQLCGAIRSFKGRGLKALYDGRTAEGVAYEHVEKLCDILAVLDRSRTAQEMNLPGLRLDALKGGVSGQYAVSVSEHWRVTFRFEGGHAADVSYPYYHHW